MSIKLFIIDRFSIVREAMKALLTDNVDIIIMGTSHAYETHIGTISRCDVLLLDHNQEVPKTLKLLKEIKKNSCDLKILLITDDWEDPTNLNELIKAGINGYITKNIRREELIYAIQTAKVEGLYISTKFVLECLEQCVLLKSDSLIGDSLIGPRPDLSLGETEVLNLISEGLTNKEIANRLFVSVRTIETRRTKLLDKTNTTNTASLIKFCMKAGLIT